jgi:hypothetical protein
LNVAPQPPSKEQSRSDPTYQGGSFYLSCPAFSGFLEILVDREAEYERFLDDAPTNTIIVDVKTTGQTPSKFPSETRQTIADRHFYTFIKTTNQLYHARNSLNRKFPLICFFQNHFLP